MPGELIYLDEQYEFALISVPMDPPETLPRFCNELMFSEDVFVLGRDKWDLQIGNGKVMNKGAGSYMRHHYMFFDADISPVRFLSVLRLSYLVFFYFDLHAYTCCFLILTTQIL